MIMNGLDGYGRTRTCFEQGKIREYWESDLELESGSILH